jgi:hypothetical protein
MDEAFISSQKYGATCQDDQLDLFAEYESVDFLRTDKLLLNEVKNESSICKYQDFSFRAQPDYD